MKGSREKIKEKLDVVLCERSRFLDEIRAIENGDEFCGLFTSKYLVKEFNDRENKRILETFLEKLNEPGFIDILPAY